MPLRDHVGKRSSRASPGADGYRSVWIWGLLLVLLMAGVAAAVIWSKGQLVPVDDDTLCATDRSPTTITAVLLDPSDTISETQRAQINNELERIWQSVPKLGRVDVYAVDRAGRRLVQPAIRICNPGSSQDANQIYQNPRLAAQRWTAFRGKLDQVLGQQLSMEAADASPILEAVQSVAILSLNQPETDGTGKRLIIVSDLMQNTPGRLSFYRAVPTLEPFKESGLYRDVRADLTGVGVQLLHLDRAEPQASRAARLFWEAYLADSGGELLGYVPINGAQ
jgi:hypothetical protein